MLLLLVAVVVLLGGVAPVKYHRPRENQYQIQGVVIEDPPQRRIYRIKRQQQFTQPFYRQKPPLPYADRPPAPTNFQQSLPRVPSNFAPQPQPYRQSLPPQQSFRPSPQLQFHRPGPPQQQYKLQPPQQFAQPPPQQQFYSPQPQPNWGQPFSTNTRISNDAAETGEYNGARYYYPPKQPFPLPICFHNPSGYVCCNQQLNDLIVDTYTELEKRPKFHTCNVNALAQHIQQRAEKRFNNTFEAIAAYDDFAQKIHFKGDMVCKVEKGGKYMLAYATVQEVQEDTLRPLPRNSVSMDLDSKLHLNRRSPVSMI